MKRLLVLAFCLSALAACGDRQVKQTPRSSGYLDYTSRNDLLAGGDPLITMVMIGIAGAMVGTVLGSSAIGKPR